MTQSIKPCLLFDIDGTLVDTDKVHILAFNEIMARYGLARLQVQRIFNRMAREQLIDRKAGRGWAFRPWLDSVESHRESYRFRMILEPAAILEPGYQVNVAELKKCRREQEALLAGGIEKATHEQLYLAGVHLHETIAAGSNSGEIPSERPSETLGFAARSQRSLCQATIGRISPPHRSLST